MAGGIGNFGPHAPYLGGLQGLARRVGEAEARYNFAKLLFSQNHSSSSSSSSGTSTKSSTGSTSVGTGTPATPSLLLPWMKGGAQDAADKAVEKGLLQDAASSDPSNPSFLDKMVQEAGDVLDVGKHALVHTIDIISRPNYASANLAKYLVSQDQGHHSGGAFGQTWNPFSFVDDLHKNDIGGALHATWEGLKGHDKTTYADVLSKLSDQNPDVGYLKNAWTQGVFGFAGDVLFDPTTYLGVGAVTKPLKKAVELGIDKSLAEEVAKTGVTVAHKAEDGSIQHVPLTADNVRRLIDGTAHEPNVVPAHLSGRQKRIWIRQHTLKGYRHYTSKSNRVATARKRLDALTTISKKLGEDIPKNAVESKSAAQFDDLLKQATAEYHAALHDIGNQAFKAKLEAHDLATSVGAKTAPGSETAAKVSKAFEDLGLKAPEKIGDITGSDILKGAIKYKDIQDVVKAYGVAKNAAKNAKKYSSQGHLAGFEDKAAKELAKQRAAEQEITDRLVQWGDIEQVAPFMEQILHAVHNQYENLPNLPIKALKDSAMHEGRKARGTSGSSLDRSMAETKSKALWQQVTDERTLLAYRMMEHVRGGDTSHVFDFYPGDKERLQIIDSEIAHLTQKINNSESTNAVVDNAYVAGEGKTPKQELHDLRQEKLQILHHYLTKNNNEKIMPPFDNVGPDFNLEQAMKDGQLDNFKTMPDLNKWPEAVKREVFLRRRKYFNTSWETVGRRARELRSKVGEDGNGAYVAADLPEHLKPMFADVPKRKQPVPALLPTKEGKVFTRDSEGIKGIEKYVTDADRAKAAKAQETMTTKDLEWLHAHGSPKSWTDESKPEYIAFDRLFKAQHGMDVKEAIREKELAEGNFVTAGYGSGKTVTVTKSEVYKFALENPEKFAVGFGVRVPWEDGSKLKSMTYAKLKQIHGEPLPHDVMESWREAVRRYIGNTYDAHGENGLRRRIHAWWENGLKAQKPVRKQHHSGEYDIRKEYDQSAMWQAAQKRAIKEVNDELIKSGGAIRRPITNSEMRAPENVPTPEELHTSGLKLVESHYNALIDQLRAEAKNEAQNSLSVQSLKARIAELEKSKVAKKGVVDDAYAEAVRTRMEVKKRWDEEIVMHALNTQLKNGKVALRFTMAGKKFLDIPVPEVMFRAVEKFSGAPLLNKAFQAWSQAFSPASTLEPELNLARLRAQSLTPEIIKHHLQELQHTFAGEKPRTLGAAMARLRKGQADDELSKKIEQEFDKFVPYANGSMKVGNSGEVLTAWDINKYLPDEYKLLHPKGEDIRKASLDSGRAILSHMRNLPAGADPMRALWQLRVGAEQALAHKALEANIRDMFAIKRQLPKFGEVDVFRHDLIERLHDDHGWVTIPRLGQDHYFPADVASEINKLLDFMHPGKQQDVWRLYDKAMRVWKSAVTVYNPGYYTRNAIGEAFMCMFDGMGPQHVRHFTNAMRILSRKMPDETKEALKKMAPYLETEVAKNPLRSKMLRLPSGETLTGDQIWYLYNEAMLKSGFVSTEFDSLFPVANKLRSRLPGRAAHNVNEAVRKFGEKQEDYWRLAHFMYRLTKQPKGLTASEAAIEASKPVRKYHFDYSDFTPFEKAYMMRMFPFYKWTRKAFPLMASMLFTQPGKVLLYPKAMNNLSIASGAVTPEQDQNGNLPNYEKVVPDWMTSMLAYPVGGKDSDSAQTYMNVQTPAFDIAKLAQDPFGAGIGLMNPIAKFILEQGRGEPLDPQFDFKYDEDSFGNKLPWRDALQNRADEVAHQTPITNLLMKIFKDQKLPGDTKKQAGDSPITEHGKIDETLLSFLTGLGFYENSSARQHGAILNNAKP